MILLTGASGFIGSHLKKYMNCVTVDKHGCDYNGDLCDQDFVKSLPNNVKTVVHLAAFNSTKNFYSTPFDVMDSIVTPTMNLLKRYPNAHFVYAGSSEEYAGTVNLGWADIPTPENVPLTIEDITNPRWCYASGKIAMESAVISHSVQHGNTYTILRYHNVYGPGQQNHFVPEFIERVKTGDYKLPGWNDTRSFCYVNDAVKLTTHVLYEENKIINIGNPSETKILDVANVIVELLNLPANFELVDSPTGSTPRRAPDLTKLTSIVSDFTWTDLTTGIKQCL